MGTTARAEAGPEIRRLDVLGHRLRAACWRSEGHWRPARPVLVLIHEGLGCIEFWKDFPAALRDRTGLDVFAWDRLGYGGSDPAEGPRDTRYLHREANTFLPAVLAAAGVARPPILFGHSDGGSIALLHAASQPVAACVTAAAHVFVEEETLAGIRAADRLYRTTDLHARLARYHGDRTDTVFRRWADTWSAPYFRDWNIEGELAAIRAPLLAMQGEDDEYGTPAQVEAIVTATGGLAEPVLLPGCGHTPHREVPEATLETIARFLERHDLS